MVPASLGSWRVRTACRPWEPCHPMAVFAPSRLTLRLTLNVPMCTSDLWVCCSSAGRGKPEVGRAPTDNVHILEHLGKRSITAGQEERVLEYSTSSIVQLPRLFASQTCALTSTWTDSCGYNGNVSLLPPVVGRLPPKVSVSSRLECAPLGAGSGDTYLYFGGWMPIPEGTHIQGQLRVHTEGEADCVKNSSLLWEGQGPLSFSSIKTCRT